MIVTIDIGGTKTLIVYFDILGKPIKEVRFATEHSPEEFLAHLDLELAQFTTDEIKAIAVAAPGMIDSKAGIILYSPNLKWKNIELTAHLSERFHCPIYLGNDANFAGLGAVQALDAIPPLALYITIGTGIGTGLIIDGDIHPAVTHAEGGHMLFQTEQGLQEWEQFASGKAIAARYKRLAIDIQEDSHWKQIAFQLVVGLRALIPALQPNIIIFGGGVGTQFDRFTGHLQTQLRAELPAFIPLPTFIQAIDPEKAVIHGCYYYALTHQNIRKNA
jgi:predicted NBD/HSP70 family sugar kinase